MAGRLSSDILERQFGPTELTILAQDDLRRIITTKAVGTGKTLEVSFVTFSQEGVRCFGRAHTAVLKGMSMGKAFRGQGIPFHREPKATYRLDAPPELARRFGSSGQITVVDLAVSAGAERTPYAGILEVYSPAVAWPDAARAADEALLARLSRLSSRLAADI